MLETIGLIAAYSGVGLGILALGYLALDLLTPGHLGRTIMAGGGPGGRANNASILACSTLVSLGLVLFFAIFFTGNRWNDLLDCAVYGGVAVLLQVVGFLLLDVLTGPGRLGEQAFDSDHRGAAMLAGAMQFAIALPICAALT